MKLYCPTCDDTFPDYVVRDVFNPECPACGEPCREFVPPEVRFHSSTLRADPEFMPALAVEPAAPTYQLGALFRRQAS